MILSFRVATALISFLALMACSGKPGGEFEVGVTTKLYPFLKHNEIALDIEIANLTGGTVLVSNLPPGGGEGVIDELSWLSAIYITRTGEFPLALERRTSEISRYRDIYNEGDFMTRRYEIMPIGEEGSLVFKLIAVAEETIPIGSYGTIKVVFEAPLHDLGIPVEELETTETFFGSDVNIDEFRDLDYQFTRFESLPAYVPVRGWE